MNLVRLAPLASIILATGMGCSSSGDDTKNSGGSPGTSGSAGQATGAAGGAGGSGGSGGSATGGTGGSTGGAGGTTAGSSGTSTGGGAGMATGGGAGMATGGGAGTATAAGGMGAGGMATGGMGGSGAIDADSFFLPNLNGLYYELRTQNDADPGGSEYWLTDASTDTCPTGADWASSGITRSKAFTAKGTPGQKYTVNFQLRGAMALRCISGGTPSGMMGDAAGTKNNAFYVGGTQFMDSPVNPFQFDVTPAVTGRSGEHVLPERHPLDLQPVRRQDHLRRWVYGEVRRRGRQHGHPLRALLGLQGPPELRS